MQNIVPLGNLESLRKSIKTNDSRLSNINPSLNIESAENSEHYRTTRAAQLALTDQKNKEDHQVLIFSPISAVADRTTPTGRHYDYYKPEKIKVQKMNMESKMNSNDYIMDYAKNFEQTDETEPGSVTAQPTVKALHSPTAPNPLDDALASGVSHAPFKSIMKQTGRNQSQEIDKLVDRPINAAQPSGDKAEDDYGVVPPASHKGATRGSEVKIQKIRIDKVVPNSAHGHSNTMLTTGRIDPETHPDEVVTHVLAQNSSSDGRSRVFEH